MRNRFVTAILGCAGALLAPALAFCAPASAPAGYEEAKFELPAAVAYTTAYSRGNIRSTTALPEKPRGPVYLPKGAFNVGRSRPITTSAKLEFFYRNWIADGDKSFNRLLDLEAGRQWIQLDLQSPFLLHGLLLWHSYDVRCVYRDVVIQLADDADFKKNVRTVFNNDQDNSSGLGKGRDREFYESWQGQWIPFKTQSARFVRLYSNGSTFDARNRYIEVEVWGSVPPGMMIAPFKLPEHPYHSGPVALPKNTTALYYPNLPRGVVTVPKGSFNAALRKPVTASDEVPIIGEASQVTDGGKAAVDGNRFEVGPGLQWVQIDLQKAHDIHGILLWHIWFDYFNYRVYRDVIVQLSDDPEFKTGVRTVYNNDQDNSAGLGKGRDREFFEVREGQWIPISSQTARYVRLYSNGSSRASANEYVEVEVWATKPLAKTHK